MRKILTTLLLCAAATSGFAQTATELVGKWQLVGIKDPNGQSLNVEEAVGTKEVYQIFAAPDTFEGVVGSQRIPGKWSLSSDNKWLTVRAEGGSTKFRMDSFTAKTRVIYAEGVGTLTYEKR
ncbi:MAG: hypothetical protein U5L74_11690 [Ideonella sp.]|nr:hypothetical protein [Ideonella sp.]